MSVTQWYYNDLSGWIPCSAEWAARCLMEQYLVRLGDGVPEVNNV